MSFTRLPASLISIWKDIQSQMCVWHDVLWNKFLIHGAFCDLWPSELSIWEEVLYFKNVFSCAKMLHHSLFSLDLCSTVVYQGDLLADGPPDVFSIFHRHTHTHTVFVLKVLFYFLRRNTCTGLGLNTLCVVLILCPNEAKSNKLKLMFPSVWPPALYKRVYSLLYVCQDNRTAFFTAEMLWKGFFVVLNGLSTWITITRPFFKNGYGSGFFSCWELWIYLFMFWGLSRLDFNNRSNYDRSNGEGKVRLLWNGEVLVRPGLVRHNELEVHWRMIWQHRGDRCCQVRKPNLTGCLKH